jgi:hypothetical protein
MMKSKVLGLLIAAFVPVVINKLLGLSDEAALFGAIISVGYYNMTLGGGGNE